MRAASLVLSAVGVGAIVVALLRRGRAGGPDAPALLLAAATRLLAGDRADWGAAMAGELGSLTGRAARWRFVLGCLPAMLLVPPRHSGPARPLLAVVLAAVVGSVALVGAGLLHYPGIVTGTGTWLALAAFVTVLCGYTLVVLVIVRHGGATGAGIIGGAGVATVWFLVAWVLISNASTPALTVLLLAIPLAGLAVGAAGAWRRGSPAAGRNAALLAGVLAGLALFLVLVSDALLTGGRPYDPGELRDFASSGAPDLATYAVNDTLGSAMMLLLLVPLLTAVLGAAGAAITGRLRRRAVPA